MIESRWCYKCINFRDKMRTIFFQIDSNKKPFNALNSIKLFSIPRKMKRTLRFRHWHKHKNYNAQRKEKMWDEIKYSMKWWRKEYDKWKKKTKSKMIQRISCVHDEKGRRKKWNKACTVHNLVLFSFIRTKGTRREKWTRRENIKMCASKKQ